MSIVTTCYLFFFLISGIYLHYINAHVVDLTKTDDRSAILSERTPHDDSNCEEQTPDLKSGHESQKGLDIKIHWLTGREL